MKCTILHETRGRMRVHTMQGAMSLQQADILEAYLNRVSGVTKATVYDRTGDAVICYDGPRETVTKALSSFAYAKEQALAPEHSSRALNRDFEDKLVASLCWRGIKQLFVPSSVRTLITVARSVPYIKAGMTCLMHRKIQVPVLDATAITVSMLRKDFKTASSIMFLLGIGDILDEWTHKKSVADLAQTMSLNVDKVWKETDAGSVLVPVADVQVGDRIVIHTGNVIPLDGKVVSGEAMVNQASITGEPLAVRKAEGGYVYAGTVVEEGDCTICVEKSAGSGRYDRIIRMIEESEKLKSATEDHASHLADQLVPYSLGATALVWLLTGNMTKALAVLMVDFSCALKLSMPIAVLSAMKEASDYHLSVKGGRFLEAVSDASTIVFDKTGTLTRAEPKVAQIVTFGGNDEADMLRLAACLEEHIRTPWPKRSSRRRRAAVCATRSVIRAWRIWSRTAFPAASTDRRSSSAATTLSLRMSTASSRQGSRPNSMLCRIRIRTCILLFPVRWQRLSASKTRCGRKRPMSSVVCGSSAWPSWS